MLEGDGRKARVASQPTAELPEVSPIPIETPQAEERVDGQQGRWTAADPYVLTAVQRRRQIVTLFRQGLSQREVARLYEWAWLQLRSRRSKHMGERAGC